MKKYILIVLVIIGTQVQGQTWTNYTSVDGLIEGNIYSMVEESKGDIWFVDWVEETTAGIGKFDGTNWETFAQGDGPSSNTYRKVFKVNRLYL